MARRTEFKGLKVGDKVVVERFYGYRNIPGEIVAFKGGWKIVTYFPIRAMVRTDYPVVHGQQQIVARPKWLTKAPAPS